MFQVLTTEDFERWLDRLRDRRAALAIGKAIIKLGSGLFGNVEPVGEGVSEIRVDVGADYRLYFTSRGSAVVVLLCGGDKSSQKRDIVKAKRMAADLT